MDFNCTGISRIWVLAAWVQGCWDFFLVCEWLISTSYCTSVNSWLMFMNQMALRFCKTKKASFLARRDDVEGAENVDLGFDRSTASRHHRQILFLQDYSDLAAGRLREIANFSHSFCANPVSDGWDGADLEIERAQAQLLQESGLDASFWARVSHAFHVKYIWILLVVCILLFAKIFFEKRTKHRMMCFCLSRNEKAALCPDCLNWQRRIVQILPDMRLFGGEWGYCR